MSKKVKSYNLSKEVINAISEKAAADDRKDSDWLNIFLTKALKLNSKPKAKKGEITDKVIAGYVPCSNGTYEVEQSSIDTWANAYPDIDILAELNKLVARLESNPKKTVSGCKRFINSWLSRAQNNVKSPRYVSSKKTSGNLQACEDFLHD